MPDIAKLTAELETNPAYDDDVVAGRDGVLLEALNTEDVALPKRGIGISPVDFMEAISGESLTAAQEARILNYVQLGTVPVHLPKARAWMGANFQIATITALRALSEQVARPADAFLVEGERRLALRDISEAVGQIAKSHINKPPILRDPTVPVPPGIIPTDPSQVNPEDVA